MRPTIRLTFAFIRHSYVSDYGAVLLILAQLGDHSDP